MDEGTELLEDFDLLMENASHSHEFMGTRKFAQPVGDGCSGVGTQLLWPRTVARKRAAIPGQGFLAFGPLVVARVRTEQLDFLREKLRVVDSSRLTPRDCGSRLFLMPSARTATCPKCGQNVDLEHKPMQMAGRTLSCSGCKTRLEIAQSRASRFIPLVALLPILFSSLTRLFPSRSRASIFLMGAVFGFYLAGLIALAILWHWEWRHPVLKIRKLPKPGITLNLDLRNP